MAAEICLSKLPQLIADPNAEFQVLLLIVGFTMPFDLSLHYHHSACLLTQTAEPIFHGTIDSI
jgi:hypothetical protein